MSQWITTQSTQRLNNDFHILDSTNPQASNRTTHIQSHRQLHMLYGPHLDTSFPILSNDGLLQYFHLLIHSAKNFVRRWQQSIISNCIPCWGLPNHRMAWFWLGFTQFVRRLVSCQKAVGVMAGIQSVMSPI
jgi:hypothetical protein